MGWEEAASRWAGPTWGARFRRPLRAPSAECGGSYGARRGDDGFCSAVVCPGPTTCPVSRFRLQFFPTCVSAQVDWMRYCASCRGHKATAFMSRKAGLRRGSDN
jgi:hypothetical protein